MQVKNFTLRLPLPVYEDLRQRAERDGKVIADLVRDAIAAAGREQDEHDKLEALESRLIARIDAAVAAATAARDIAERVAQLAGADDDTPQATAVAAAEEAA